MQLSSDNPSLVPDIRAASRDLVRELGFLNRTLAGTDLSPSAVHAIVEIGLAGALPARALTEKLILEKSTVSRLLVSLLARGLVTEKRSAEDGRVKQLSLTAAGEALLARITGYAEDQVQGALAPMSGEARRNVLLGLRSYADALAAHRHAASGADRGAEAGPGGGRDRSGEGRAIVLGTGYLPGIVGRIAEMHATYYSRTSGFDAAFEGRVAAGLADFVTRLDRPQNGLWHAAKAGRIGASIAIDGEDLGAGRAHLRWFIVDSELRGAGLGGRLLAEALAFCDARGFAETQLWTFRGLDAARHLYVRHGFVLAEEYRGDQWGREVVEQRFVRRADEAAMP
ncbi:helix-turn-helix domain-containing GNAT family N-acetyltransferase [Afifella sp. IM 167]|uniref:bifunctional helix-turn-helix transcriptional regulator/GNAT family N-acetyltransferase n=1 Tax=Afifella sp. IM 167 TaxID=2033586 RepID=UPI001CCE0793|nr:helix-turn-helix domain-containing GNAT family N-acetyltransferase [Afifella sp. IM 167]MBZ8133713.1 MarR family transcriptional regulator [Afifella sp. IM 167]